MRGLEHFAELLAFEFVRNGHSVEVVTDITAPVGFAEFNAFKVMRTNRLHGRIGRM